MDRVGKCFLATCHKRVSPTSYSLLGTAASLTFSKYEAVNDVGGVVLWLTRNRETMFLYRGLLGVDTERKINIVYKANKNKQLDSIDGRMSNNF